MKKAVFLDRDGTINVEKNYLYKAEEFEFLPGAIEGMQKLLKAGYLLIIITNQSGIARGYYTESQYKALEKWMLQQLELNGVQITDVYYCPHLENAPVKAYAVTCNCRKPKLGLFEKAIKEYEIDVEHSVAIGDKMRDLEICKHYPVKGFLVYAKEMRYENICCLSGGIDQVADIIVEEQIK